MKKILAVILAAVTLSLCLTGCVYEDLSVKLNKDETGSVTATVGLKKDFVDQMMGGQNPFDGKETNEIEIDGESYIAYTETTEYGSFEEIAKALSDMTYDTYGYEDSAENETDGDPETEIAEEPDNTETFVIDEWLTESTEQEEADNHIFKSVEIKKDGSKYVFDAVLNPLTGDVSGYDMSDIFKVSISAEMPAKITAYKNGTVDGNRVTFDLSDMSEETELYAECKITSKAPAIIGLVLAVGAVVAFVVLRKRK